MNFDVTIVPQPINGSTSLATFKRDRYGALPCDSLPKRVKDLTLSVVKLIGFSAGVTSTNRKGGFVAHNFDVYGYDGNLVALQFRQTSREKEGYWLQQEKIYALAGIDDGQLFCHAIPSSFRMMRNIDQAAPPDVVRWAESKIFQVPLARLNTIIRQGDIALVPVRSIPRDAIKVHNNRILFRKSHKAMIDGDLYELDGRFWVDGLIEIEHLPGQHRAIDAQGRHEIVRGIRLASVEFSTPD